VVESATRRTSPRCWFYNGADHLSQRLLPSRRLVDPAPSFAAAPALLGFVERRHADLFRTLTRIAGAMPRRSRSTFRSAT
jgi:hypothetical protein